MATTKKHSPVIKFFLTIFILLFLSSQAISQDKSIFFPGVDTITFDELTLTKRNRVRVIPQYDDLIVYFKSSDYGSAVKRIRGDLLKRKGDSLYLDYEHFANNHLFSRIDSNEFIKIAQVKNITKIKQARENFNNISGLGIGLSIFSTLIVSPLVCLQKSGFNGDRYLKVAGTSLAATALFTTLRLTFSHKRFKVGQKRNSWKIVYF